MTQNKAFKQWYNDHFIGYYSDGSNKDTGFDYYDLEDCWNAAIEATEKILQENKDKNDELIYDLKNDITFFNNNREQQ